MPATAGRVKMPAGNRMQTSASLNTHSIWQNAIGYDPYAAESTGADTGANAEQETYDKWPVWARLVIIVGLSALLWAGIISALVALFG